MNPIIQQMLQHSSVRSYLDKAIEPELIDKIIECGLASASSSFVQARSIVRVTDQQNRAVMAKIAGGQWWVEKAPEFFILCADMNMVQYCCDKTGQAELEGFTEHFITATVDVSLMAQNMMLAAESLGLGGVFIGGMRNDPEQLSEILELPKHVYPVCGLCLGWPKKTVDTKPRFPVSTVLHQEKYDAKSVPANVDAFDLTMQDYYVSRASNAKQTNWSEETVKAVQGKTREHMLPFLKQKGFLKK